MGVLSSRMTLILGRAVGLSDGSCINFTSSSFKLAGLCTVRTHVIRDFYQVVLESTV